MSGYEWQPETYLAQMLDEIPGYAELQDAVAAATAELQLGRVLELGTGTGETAVRILAQHPAAEWVGIDASDAMLARARERLPHADLRTARLEDPLPEGPFDLVVSALAVHHLDEEAKRRLFTRIAQLSHNFVMGDVVVPERPEDAVIEIDGVYDVPSSVADQLAWLEAAGFDATATYVRADLALFVARRRRR
jgi:tRNA (cmo5U34)-methyltransferase